jgi:tetratricopeptide (TPR) repeat protein
MHWLSTYSKPWLLIIDNADDPDMEISKYFPPGGKGHILITTRNPGAVIHATIGDFHFSGMDPDEAITLLLKSAHQPNKPVRCDDESKKFASGIACELGYLALALTHAGATIRRNIYTLEKYLHYYLGYRKGMMGYSHIKNPDDASIITTWEIPFRRIATRESVEYRDAADLMHIFAFMHFESIPESIFERYWSAVEGTESKLTNYPDILQNKSAWSEETHARLRRALNILCDYSIIDHDPDKGLCSLHPVIHSWARGRLTLVDQKRWLSYTSTVLACCISLNLEASGRAFRRLLLPHIDSCLRALHSLYQLFPENVEQAAEVDKFASVYAENGLWKLAREWQHKVIELRTRKLGKQHRDTIQAQVSLGYIYWNKFEIKSAIEVQNQVRISQWWLRPSLASWTTCLPWKPDHISYSMALSDLTQTLWLAGRRNLSKMTGERAVQGLIKHLGPDDPITLNAMFNLARTYLHLDEYKKCHELLILVVKKRKRFFGPNHVDTLMARNELGMSYRAQGRMDIAERIVTNVVESRKKVLGEEHAYTLWSVNDLSKILCDRGRPENAVSMLEDIIPVVIRTLGEEHVGMVMTQSNLARAYSLCERRNEALVLLRKLTDVIPSNHPDWIHAMSGSVHVRFKLGQLEEIEKDCNKMLDIIINTKVLTLDNPRTLAVAEQLLRIYRDQGRSDDILALKKRVPGINENNDAQKGLLAMLYGTYVRNGKARLISTFL